MGTIVSRCAGMDNWIEKADREAARRVRRGKNARPVAVHKDKRADARKGKNRKHKRDWRYEQ